MLQITSKYNKIQTTLVKNPIPIIAKKSNILKMVESWEVESHSNWNNLFSKQFR